MPYRILSINPGSTSTKIALYEDEKELYSVNIEHSMEELKGYGKAAEQLDFRTKAVLSEMKKQNTDLSKLSAVVGRGGMFPPVSAGGYLVNENMKRMI
jgi:butyrate kinase